MNKAFIAIIIAVCILGMALIMLTQWQAQNADPEPAASRESAAATAPSGGELTLPPSVEAPSGQPAQPSAGMERGFAFDDTSAQQVAAAPQPAGNAEPPAVAPDLPQEVLAESHAPALGSGTASGPALPVEKTPPAAEAPKTPATAAPAPAAPLPVADEPAPAPESRKAESKAQTAKPARTQATPARTVTRFVVYARESGATIRLVGSSPIAFKEPFALKEPDRVVVDLVGDWKIKAPGVPKNPLVTNVRLGKMDNRTRVVIDMNGPARVRYTLSKDHKQLDVRVDR